MGSAVVRGISTSRVIPHRLKTTGGEYSWVSLRVCNLPRNVVETALATSRWFMHGVGQTCFDRTVPRIRPSPALVVCCDSSGCADGGGEGMPMLRPELGGCPHRRLLAYVDAGGVASILGGRQPFAKPWIVHGRVGRIDASRPESSRPALFGEWVLAALGWPRGGRTCRFKPVRPVTVASRLHFLL